jgi:hypothetical protein
MTERKTGVYLCSGCGIGDAVPMASLEAVAKTGKRTYFRIGGATLGEIEAAVDLFRQAGNELENNAEPPLRNPFELGPALRFAALLVVILFLQTWRASIIPLIAVPVSIVGTFAWLYLLGYSINTLTLFGLVLAVGIVVDDAIVRHDDGQLTIAEACVDLHPSRAGMRDHGAQLRHRA